MKETVFRPRDHCPKCGILFLIGPPFHDWKEEATKRGIRRLSMDGSGLDQADGVWLGDLVSPETDVCPRCAAPIGEAVEVLRPERCGLCSKPPQVFWMPVDRVYIGLCHACDRTEAGERWRDRMFVELQAKHERGMLDWFKEYTRRMDEAAVIRPEEEGKRYNCPCCGYPTLESRGQYDICHLCWWEDDGQDDPHADEIWGGPNKSYSLSHARRNFAQHLCMYEPENDSRLGGPDSPAVKEAKRRLMSAYEAVRSETEATKLVTLWQAAHDLEKELESLEK